MSSEVPKGWSSVALGDVIRLEYGRALSASVREAGNVPVYGSNGICGEHSAAFVNERGIVVGRKGTAGSVTVTTGPFWPIDTTYFVVPRVEADFDWLAATLVHARLSELNEATGVPGLSRDKAYVQPILLPPLDEQRRIAEVLRSIDETIRTAERAASGARSARTALLADLFHRADWEPERALPSGWQTPLLDMVARRGSGHTPNKKFPIYWNGEVKWISLQDTKRLDRVYIAETTATITPEGLANSSAVLHPANTVVVSRDATVGRSAIMMSDMAVSQHFISYTCGPTLSPLYLYYWLQRMKPVLERIGAGSTIKTIGLAFFKSLKIAIPERAEQDAAADLLWQADKQVFAAEAAIVRLSSVKRAVATDLLSGRVRVPA